MIFTYVCFALIFLVNAQGSTHSSDGHCVWYGEYRFKENVTTSDNKTSVKEQIRNYVHDGQAKVLNSTGMELLEKYCPDFKPKDNLTCCNVAQLQSIQEYLQMLEDMLSSDQACYRNLLQSVCRMTCDPHQSKFMQGVQKKQTLNRTEDKWYIDEIAIHVTNQYMEGTFNSCKTVIDPWNAESALGSLCNVSDVKECNAKKWFSYMGTPLNGYVPFQITYNDVPKPPESTIEPLDPQIIQSNSSTSIPSNNGHCVWYGEKKVNNEKLTSKRNYFYNGPAKLLNSTGMELLQSYCPDFVPANNLTCCDVAQLQTADFNLKMLGSVVGSCPVCHRNLLQAICHIMCDPHQSKFMKAVDKKPADKCSIIYSGTLEQSMCIA